MDTKGLVTFLNELRIHNTREWFDLNRKRYSAFREEFVELVEAVIFLTGVFDEKIRYLLPKNCIFRINRDVRFSKDKSLYKTHMGASFADGEKNGSRPGYYFEINADGELFFGGGLYMPDGKQLSRIRDSIDTRPEKLKSIIENPKFVEMYGEFEGEKLKTAPHGFPKDHPEIELLKLKSFAVGVVLPINKISPKEIHQEIVTRFKVLYPLVEFLRDVTAG